MVMLWCREMWADMPVFVNNLCWHCFHLGWELPEQCSGEPAEFEMFPPVGGKSALARNPRLFVVSKQAQLNAGDELVEHNIDVSMHLCGAEAPVFRQVHGGTMHVNVQDLGYCTLKVAST